MSAIVTRIRAAAIAFAGQVERLGLKPSDKWAHAIVGAVATAVLAAFGLGALQILAAVLFLAVIKELVDHAAHTVPDWRDILATVAVPLVYVLVHAAGRLAA
jgi:uncharacterized protein involved in cysteine biosynthesis